jgi:methionyl-tRNA formyltransferase
MGTPQFAAPSLSALAQTDLEIVAVYVQPDRPAGRGRKTSPPPVKQVALHEGLPVHQPLDANSASSLDLLRSLTPDLFVVVAYGCILSPELLAVPKLGAVNLHASLLPDYRGASPVPYAILDGREETGVTSIWMDPGIDTGDMILQRRIAIGAEENTGELTARLAEVGAALLVETVRAIAAGTAPRTPQDRSTGRYCKKLKKGEGAIDWSTDAESITRHVRAMTPWPGAFSELEVGSAGGEAVRQPLRIERARVVDSPGGSAPSGTVRLAPVGDTGHGVIVTCGEGSVELVTVRPAGKRSMAAGDWWRGLRVSEGRLVPPRPMT